MYIFHLPCRRLLSQQSLNSLWGYKTFYNILFTLANEMEEILEETHFSPTLGDLGNYTKCTGCDVCVC